MKRDFTELTGLMQNAGGLFKKPARRSPLRTTGTSRKAAADTSANGESRPLTDRRYSSTSPTLTFTSPRAVARITSRSETATGTSLRAWVTFACGNDREDLL